MNFVQSAVTSISFPDKLEDVRAMKGRTDIDSLVNFDAVATVTWTAPTWMYPGDILFFYHTKSAKQQIAKLRKAASDTHHDASGITGRLKHLVSMFSGQRSEYTETIRLLEHAAKQAESYSGAIFGCAMLSGSAEYLEPEDGRHFSSSSFAPLGQVHIFKHPLPADNFADLVKIGQGATARLHKPQFKGLKDLLGANNDLPGFLKNATGAEMEFSDINQDNWPHIACAENKRFIDETHLRLNFIDYLLEELKDEGAPLVRECRCPSGGRADYFVKMDGNWVPVEAKLNILTERNILGQVELYTRQSWFRPTQGEHENETFSATSSGTCLVVDQSGIYVISGGRFSDCSPGKPVWRREDIGHELLPEIREHILKEREV